MIREVVTNGIHIAIAQLIIYVGRCGDSDMNMPGHNRK